MNNNKEQREILRLIRKMNPEQREIFDGLLEDVKKLSNEAKEKGVTEKQFTKALFIVDMNNGFVNFGAMANTEYNALVPEQLKLIERFRKEQQLVNFILEGHIEEAVEFLLYPQHCVLGTPEAELIPEFKDEQDKENTKVYYKNSINGALNLDLQIDLEDLRDLKEIVVCGVCTDLCVLDFVRTLARYLDEINHKVQIFVVASVCSTFDAPGHERTEEEKLAYRMMRAAGVEVVANMEELEQREKVLGLAA
ncbi:MAG: cysteine hydrolase [Erysipelotrichales bacterium]|nr:cysteine hydrolase [Erysipelotrichales bacterium]